MPGRLRSALTRLALVAGLCVALAGAASAGDFPVPPVNTAACGSADVDGTALAGPDAFNSAATPELCNKLCDRAAKLCGVYVKDVVHCLGRYVASYRTFGTLNCESIYGDSAAELRQCKENVKTAAEDLTADVKNTRETELGDCEIWRLNCRGGCAGF